MADDFFKQQEAQLEAQKALRAEFEQQGKLASSKNEVARAAAAWRKAHDAQAAAEKKNPIVGRMARAATIGVTVSLGAVFRVIPGGRNFSNAMFGVAGVTALRSHSKAKAARPAIRQANADTNDAVRANAAANQAQTEARLAMQQANAARNKANQAMVLARTLQRG